jgi:hypothetical protein
MFKSLDVLIGFSAIMLLISVAVTVLTQTISGVFGWRGRHLVRGIVTIVHQIDPKMMPFCAQQIALAVLRHPVVTTAQGKLGTVIQREELTRVLLELAAGREPGGKSLDEYARGTLKRAIGDNGIANPADSLDNIHLLELKLEAIHPDLPSPIRHNLAAATEAPSQFFGRLHACFDGIMDRVTQRFAAHVRLTAVGVALAVAVGLQLDAFELWRRISLDPAGGYAMAPEAWKSSWHLAKIPGVALSVMLLSLGAPFWYDALKDLIALRPVLARTEQAHREQRQTARAAVVSPAPYSTSEKGDLTATGGLG